MSSPTIRSTATWDSAGVAAANVRATIPAGVVAGDLLLIVMGRPGQNGSGTVQTGYTVLSVAALGGAGNYDAQWFYRVADGSEASTTPIVTVTNGADPAGTITYVITAGTWGDIAVAGAWSTPTSTLTPDPPSLTTGFGSADLLAIEMALIKTASRTFTPSTGYSNAVTLATNIGAISMATASRTVTAASEDPGTVSWSGAAATSSAITIAVRGPVPITSAGDTSSGSDASANQTKATVDTSGTTSDVSTQTAAYVPTDTSSGSDASVNQTHATAETGTGADASANQTKATTETGTGVDTSGRTSATTDTGTGSDVSTKIMGVVDTGATTERLGNRNIVVVEQPVTTESLRNRTLRLTDSGTDFEDGTRSAAPYTAGNMLTMLVSGRQWGVAMPFLLGGLAVDVEMPFSIDRAALGHDATLPFSVRGPFGVSWSLPVDIQGPVGAERGLPFHLLDNETGQFPEGGVASPVMGFWEPDDAVIE